LTPARLSGTVPTGTSPNDVVATAPTTWFSSAASGQLTQISTPDRKQLGSERLGVGVELAVALGVSVPGSEALVCRARRGLVDARADLDRGGGRRLDERRDDLRGLVGLRMPLHAQGEAAARDLDGLGQVVHVRPARHLQPLANGVDRLMVV
jgi:hypothetical protein